MSFNDKTIQKTVVPEGHVHWFYRCFKWFRKDILLGYNNDQQYTLVCNRAVYTTDGRFFYGWYTPDDLEDLDPFCAIPPDFLFCCQCCWRNAKHHALYNQQTLTQLRTEIGCL